MNETTQPERLWIVSDVQGFLRVSETWVYSHVASGDLPYLRVGGLLRFWPSEIQSYARGERGRPAAMLVKDQRGTVRRSAPSKLASGSHTRVEVHLMQAPVPQGIAALKRKVRA